MFQKIVLKTNKFINNNSFQKKKNYYFLLIKKKSKNFTKELTIKKLLTNKKKIEK